MSSLLPVELAPVGHFPFQITCPIVFTSTRVLVKPAVLMFGSENMVIVIIVLPRVEEMRVQLIILLSSRWMIYFLPNENGEISRAIYLIFPPHRFFFFFKKLAPSEKAYFQERISKDTEFLWLSWSLIDLEFNVPVKQQAEFLTVPCHPR